MPRTRLPPSSVPERCIHSKLFKQVDSVQELFVAARDEIEYAKEEAETVREISGLAVLAMAVLRVHYQHVSAGTALAIPALAHAVSAYQGHSLEWQRACSARKAPCVKQSDFQCWPSRSTSMRA
jgi:hypothetical protein